MVCLFIIILTPDSSALRINELESNPEGEDSGFEWIELYSADSVNLDGYVLDHEGRGAPMNLSGSFQGYFVIEFDSLWLRNSNETVYLKLNGDLVDSVGPFADNKVEKTYSFCDGEWEFISSTKNEENDCGTSSRNNEQDDEEPDEEVVQEVRLKTEKNITILSNPDESVNKKITLGKSSDSEVTRTYKVRIGVIYFFIGFCVFLVILIALRKL